MIAVILIPATFVLSIVLVASAFVRDVLAAPAARKAEHVAFNFDPFWSPLGPPHEILPPITVAIL
jgi:hypothetical protein